MTPGKWSWYLVHNVPRLTRAAHHDKMLLLSPSRAQAHAGCVLSEVTQTMREALEAARAVVISM